MAGFSDYTTSLPDVMSWNEIDRNSSLPSTAAQRRFLDMTKTFDDKLKAVEDNKFEKLANINDYIDFNPSKILDADTLQVNINGKPERIRISSGTSLYFDAIDDPDTLFGRNPNAVKSPNAVRRQLIQVSEIVGKPVWELTDDDIIQAKNWQSTDFFRRLIDPNFKFQKYDPTQRYEDATGEIQNLTLKGKVLGRDNRGRLIMDVLNPNTKSSLGFDLATNPYTNSYFNEGLVANTPVNEQFQRNFELANKSLLSTFEDNRRIYDTDSRLSESLDLAKSAGYQSLARALQHVPGFNNKYWERIANSKTGQRWADLAMGVNPNTRDEFSQAGKNIQKYVEDGDYSQAVIETLANIDRFLAESAPQMGMLAAGMAATGGLAAYGVAGRLAALGLGAVPVALDKTLQDAEDFKTNNGRSMTSAEYARTFAGALLTTVPEELVFGMFGDTAKGVVSKLLKRGLGSSIVKTDEKILTDAGKRFLGSVAGEGGQEWMETTWDTASSAKQDGKNFWTQILPEAATSDETKTAALIGATMGGALGAVGTGLSYHADVKLNERLSNEQAKFEKQRIEETPAGTKANSKISEEALGRMSKITVEPGQSAKDSKVALDALSKEDNYLLNGKANEEKYKKVSQANLNIATEMTKNGASDEEIKKATGKSKKDIFADYAYTYGSGYNSEYARRHNVTYNKVDNDAMEKELMAIAKSLGLTKEEAKKTLDEVKIDIRRGPNGYENYGAQIKKGHEILENNPNLSDEEKLDITNTIKGYAARLFHLYGYETAKLEAFADKYDLIDEGKASKITVPYPNQKKGFDLDSNKLASYSFDTKFNAHGVVQDIYDSLKEMQAIMDDPSVMAKTTRDAYIQGYNANFGLKVDTTAPDTLYKRIRSAADRIFARGIQETKPVAQITDKDRVNVVGKLEKMLQLEEEKKQGSESWSEKRRYFFKALRDQPDAYDKITGFIDSNDKISSERKKQLKKRLTELKDSLATTDARMQQNAVSRDTVQAKAKNILKTVTADFLKQHSYVSGKDTPEKWEAKKKRLELLHDDLVKTYTDADGNKHLSLIKQLEETSNNSVEDKKLIQDLKKLANDINNTKRNSDTLYRKEHKPVNKPSKLITGTTISKNKIELSETKIKNIKNSDVEPLNNHLNNLLRDMGKNRQDQQNLAANNQSTIHKKEEMSKLYAEAELVIETLMEKAPDKSYKKEALNAYNAYKLSDEELTSQSEQTTSQSKTSTSTSTKPASRKAVQGQMSESAKKAFDALATAKKIDTLKNWEAYYTKEKNKYTPGTQEYADVMQTKAYVTKLINELTKSQKSSKPAEKPTKTASSETTQETSEKAPESSQSEAKGQDDKSQGKAQQMPPTASQEASEGSQETTVNKAGEGYVLHSGGANGSDIAWSTIAKDLNLNITSNHYYIGKKGSKNAPNGNVKLDASFINEAMPHIQDAARAIGKNAPTNSFVKQLIARDWMQVKGSDSIFAISDGWFKNRTQEIVDGGTGWAVQMAINEAEKAEEQEIGSSKPIYVFDTPTNTWYKFNVSNYTSNVTSKWFEPIDYIPKLTKNFAGIGSRFERNNYVLPDNAKEAITNVYKATFGDTSNTPENASRIDQNAQRVQTPTETQQVPENGSQSEIQASQEKKAYEPDNDQKAIMDAFGLTDEVFTKKPKRSDFEEGALGNQKFLMATGLYAAAQSASLDSEIAPNGATDVDEEAEMTPVTNFENTPMEPISIPAEPNIPQEAIASVSTEPTVSNINENAVSNTPIKASDIVTREQLEQTAKNRTTVELATNQIILNAKNDPKDTSRVASESLQSKSKSLKEGEARPEYHLANQFEIIAPKSFVAYDQDAYEPHFKKREAVYNKIKLQITGAKTASGTVVNNSLDFFVTEHPSKLYEMEEITNEDGTTIQVLKESDTAVSRSMLDNMPHARIIYDMLVNGNTIEFEPNDYTAKMVDFTLVQAAGSGQLESLMVRHSATPDEALRMFGLDEDTASAAQKAALVKLINNSGSSAQRVASYLGRQLLLNMGLIKSSKGFEQEYERIAVGLGLHMITYGEKLGLLKINKVQLRDNNNKLLEGVDTALGSVFGAKNLTLLSPLDPKNEVLLDLKDQWEGHVDKDGTPLGDGIKRFERERPETSKQIYGKPSQHNASETLYVRNTKKSNTVGQTQKDFVFGTLNGIEYKLDMGAAKTILNSANAFRSYMGYKFDSEGKNIANNTEELGKLSLNAQLRVCGVNKDIDSQLEALANCIKDIEEIRANGGTEKDTSIYFEHFVSRNLRFFIDSTEINPQVKKIQRFCITPRKAWYNYNLKETDDAARVSRDMLENFALAQAFDNIKNTDNAINIFAETIKGWNLETIKKLKTIFDTCKSKEEFEARTEKELKLKLGMENAPQALGAIIHLARRAEAKEKGLSSFYTNFMVENDATTSGYAVKFANMPLQSILEATFRDEKGNIIRDKDGKPLTANLMEKVGIFKFDNREEFEKWKKGFEVKDKDGNIIQTIGDNDVTMHLIKAQKGFQDIYRTTGLGVHQQLVALNTVEAFKKRIEGPQKRKNEKISDDELTKLAESVDDIYQTLLPALPKADVNEDTKEVTIGGKLRELMKYPTMFFGYSAGMKTISRNVANILLDEYSDVYMMICNMGIDYYKANYKNDKDYAKNIAIYNTFEKLDKMRSKPHGTLADNMREKLFSEIWLEQGERRLTLDRYFEDLIGATYGDAIGKVLENQFGDYVHINNMIIWATTTMYQMYAKCREDGIKKLLETYTNGKIPISAIEELTESLYKQYPFIKTASSQMGLGNKPDSRIDLMKDRKQIDSTTQVQNYVYNDKGQLENNITGYGESIIPATPGRSGAVLPIHGLDSHEIMYTGKIVPLIPINTVHDALVMSAFDQILPTRGYNAATLVLGDSYNILQEIYDNFKRCCDAEIEAKYQEKLEKAKHNEYVDRNLIEEEFYKNVIVDDRGNTVDVLEYAKGANEKENNEIVYEGEFTRRYLKERMERWVKFINDAREAFYGNGAIIYCCNSDGAMGSGYVYQRQPGAPMNADARLKQLINTDQQLRYGSTYAGYKTDSELKILHQRALNDPKARNEILHDLNGMAKDTNDLVVSDEFMKELEDLVLNANPEALKDSVYELIENGQFTAGDTLISRTGEARVRVFMDDKQHIDAVTQRAVESQMAPAEIFAHEIEHAVLHPAFTMTEALGLSAKIQELNRYYEIARGLIKAEDFMIEGDYDPNLRDLYKRHAQRSYEYFFNNPDIANNRGLHEWAALIRTSEKFRNILKQRYTEKYGEKPATKFIDKLINLIKSITDVLFKRKSLVQAFPNIFGSNSTKAKAQGLQLLDEIDNIIDTIARANNRAVKKLEQHPAKAKEAFFKFLGTWVQNHNRPLGQWMKKHTIELAKTMGWDKLGIDKKIPVRGSFFDTAKLYASTVLMYPISPRHRKMWRELLTRVFKVSQQGLLFSICRDFVKPDYNSSMLEFQALQSKTADTDSKAIEGLVRTDLEKGFDRKLNLEERVSLTHSLLYTDAQCLLYRGFNYIKQTLTSDLFREHEIQKHLDYLKKKFRSDDDYYWMCSQCMGTARFMVTGQGNEQLNTNAYGIAIGNFYDKPIEFDEETYHHLDELITLYAIQNTADDYKTLAMSLDQKGLENFLNTHRDFVDESTNGVKVDDMDMSKTKQILEPIHVVKGYTKALIDTTYETQLAPIDDQSQRLMRAQGFKLVHKIYPNDVTKKDYVVGLYKRYGIPKRRDGAAFNLIGYHAMGTTLESMSYQDVLSMPSGKDDDPVSLAEKRIRLAELYKKNAEAKSAQLRKRMTNGPMTFADFDKLSYGFSPIASPIGSGQAIADYRITMSLENKRKIFGLDEDGITELSKMFASMNKKAKASAANKELIKFLIDDMKKNMDPDTHLGKHGKAYNYIKLSEFTDNKYLKEAWRVLPKELKEAMKEQEIWVREDWLQQLFGVANMSLNDTWLVKKIPSYYLKRLIGVAEMIMKTIAYYRKQSIVLKIPGVLIGNIVSNFMFSVANHQNPLKVLKLTILNAKAIREYLNTKKQLNTIILKQRLGTATSDEIASKNLLRTRLQNNMVHPLMEMGMYQSIVEDLNPEELESTSKLTKLLKYNKYSDKIPTGIKNVARHVFLAEGTPIYDFMFTATQYSDFISRATEYQLTMEKQDKVYKNLMESKPTPENKRYFDKKTGYERFKADYKKIALIRVLNAFINYDKPQSKFEQYMNDIGALMFSKFAKRIQHVIVEQLWENPLGALAFLLSQHFLVDTEDIFEQNVFSKNWSSLFNTPWDNFQGAVVPMPLQILFGNQKFMG